MEDSYKSTLGVYIEAFGLSLIQSNHFVFPVKTKKMKNNGKVGRLQIKKIKQE